MPPLTPARAVSVAVALLGLVCCSAAIASPRSECQSVCKAAHTSCLDACRLDAGGDEIVDGLIKATMVACQKACKEAWRDCRTSCQDLPGAPKGPETVGGTAPPSPPPPEDAGAAAPPEEDGGDPGTPLPGTEEAARGEDDPRAVTGFLALALGGLCCGSGLLALVAGIVFLVARRRPAGPGGGSGGSPGGGA